MKGVQKGRVMFGEPAGAMREGFEAIMAHNTGIYDTNSTLARLFLVLSVSYHLVSVPV